MGILLTIITILFVLLVMLLFIPFEYLITGQRYDSIMVFKTEVVWFFGAVRYRILKNTGQKTKNKLVLMGISINIPNDKKKEKPGRKEKKRKSKLSSIEAIKKLLAATGSIIKHVLPEELIIKGKAGFEDPYHTGLLCALVETIKPMIGKNISISYVFDDEICEGEIKVRGSLYLFYVAYIASKLLLYRPVRKLIINGG